MPELSIPLARCLIRPTSFVFNQSWITLKRMVESTNSQTCNQRNVCSITTESNSRDVLITCSESLSINEFAPIMNMLMRLTGRKALDSRSNTYPTCSTTGARFHWMQGEFEGLKLQWPESASVPDVIYTRQILNTDCI